MLPDIKLEAGKAALAADTPKDAVAHLTTALGLSADPARRTTAAELLDQALILSGQGGEADDRWSFEAAGGASRIALLERLVLSAVASGSFSRALTRLSEIEHRLPPASRWMIRYRCLVGLGDAAGAYAHIDAAKEDLPASAALRYRTHVLLLENRYPEVLDALSTATGIRSGELLHLQTRAFVGTGQHDRVETEIATFREFFPDEPWIDYELARNASVARWTDLALSRWTALAETQGDELQVLQGLVDAFVEESDFEAAARALDQAEGEFPRARIDRLRAKAVRIEGDVEGATAILQSMFSDRGTDGGEDLSTRTQAEIWGDLARLRLMTFERSARPEAMADHVAFARKALAFDPDKLSHKVALCNALIRSGDAAEAKEAVAALPAINRADVMRLQMWRHDLSGDLAAARAAWKTRTLIHYVPQVHGGKTANLARRDEAALPPKDALTLYTCVRNERPRLPWFFDHYRRLGISHFVFVDNGSSDGTTEFLLSQPGTNVFYTEDSYYGGYSGMSWINHLRARHSPSGWSLYVDVDEALIYDGCDKHTIPDLAERLDSAGDEALTGFMLDMFSMDDPTDAAPDGDIDYVTRYPLYLPQMATTPKPVCPYVQIRGGLRAVFETGEELTKTPLVKSGRHIDFLRSSHDTSPARISDTTAVLLHYKIIDGVGDEAERVLKEQQRSPHCRVRYARYQEARDLADLIGAASKDVHRYTGPEDLISDGLMTSIDWSDADD